jgi:hypothetical protein
MKYEIKVNVMRFKQGEVLDESVLKIEGIDANKWIKEGLLNPIIEKQVEVKEVKKEVVKEEVKETIVSQVSSKFKIKKSQK